MLKLNMGKSVILFREPRENGDETNSDPYETLLSESSLSATSVPVLAYEFINSERLRDHLRRSDELDGIVVTSPRAVQALATSWEEGETWTNLPFFVVGEATRDAAVSRLNPLCSHPLSFFGMESLNANNLAEYIIRHFTKRIGDGIVDRPRLLYPASSIRSPSFQEKLEKSGIECSAISAYDTLAHPSILNNLRTFSSTLPRHPDAFVFFSPSGVKITSPIFEAMEWPVDEIAMVAIGPSTMKAIEAKGYVRKYVAEKPTPEAAWRAVMTALDLST